MVLAAYVASAGRRLLREGLQSRSQLFSEVRTVTNTATSDYHAMQLQLQRRLAKKWQGLIAYTWSHSTDNASTDSTINSPFVHMATPPQKSASDFDVRHSLSAALTYNMPALLQGAPFRPVFRNWSIDAIVKTRTATPVSVVISRELFNGEIVELFYPDYDPAVPLYVNDTSAAGARRINRAAFTGTGTGPAIGRNSLRGFDFFQADLSLRRQFHFRERLQLQLKAEVFNVFNHPNFGNPVGDLRSSLFGKAIQMLDRRRCRHAHKRQSALDYVNAAERYDSGRTIECGLSGSNLDDGNDHARNVQRELRRRNQERGYDCKRADAARPDFFGHAFAAVGCRREQSRRSRNCNACR